MSLFDNQPLTESEIAARIPCVCGESFGLHGSLDRELTLARHSQYHQRRSEPCGEGCAFDPALACSHPACTCVRFREAKVSA